jgi:hypothetical protein
MKFKMGIVPDHTSLMQDGTFKVNFGAQDDITGEALSEDVHYVTPYGSPDAGDINIPLPKSVVLCAEMDVNTDDGQTYRGIYYLGSVMGNIPGLNNQVPNKDEALTPNNEYVDKTSPGMHGPPVPEGQVAYSKEPGAMFPYKFSKMYEGKGVVPEQIGKTSQRGDAMMMSYRSRPNDAAGAFQDYRTSMQSGSGKSIECVDTPGVDAIVIKNEHKGNDCIVLSSGQKGPYAEGEMLVRTHGPINQYTTRSQMHYYVHDGHNLIIENKAGGKWGRKRAGEDSVNYLVSNGEKEDGPSTRLQNYGNETYGCVEIISRKNNITIRAENEDSVVRVETPGAQSRTIINTGGTVDIVADKKITLRSGTEVEITAPEVDINGTNNVFIDGDRIDLNLPHGNPAT